MGGSVPLQSNGSITVEPQRASGYPDLAIALFTLLITLVLWVLFLFIRRRSAASTASAHLVVTQTQAHDPGTRHNKPQKYGPAKPGIWGHTGEIIFCEVFKKPGLYNLTSILKSPVGVLGSGDLGTTYKVVLLDGSVIALKRLKEVNVKQKEFEHHMTKFGKLHMKNVVPPQSFYYSKELKFIIYNYFCLGSLFSLLQGGKRYNHTPLDWPTRLDLAIDVARGLRNLHRHSFVHGNLKSANVFMNIDFTSFVSEHGLVQISPSMHADEAIKGYRAPELVDSTAPTSKSDVYSYGVLLMELLTGLSPTMPPSQTGMASPDNAHTMAALDLPLWVEVITQDKSIDDVFDSELRSTLDHFDTVLVQMLHVAKACISVPAESRPSMNRVLRMLKEIRILQYGPSCERKMLDYESPSDSDQPNAGTSSMNDEHAQTLSISVRESV